MCVCECVHAAAAATGAPQAMLYEEKGNNYVFLASSMLRHASCEKKAKAEKVPHKLNIFSIIDTLACK